jgi:arabinan endo-1,5-alpha-L-arabinosidase
MFCHLYLAALPLLLAALVRGYADPGRCTGACNVRDPGLVRRESDGRYFLFSTHERIQYSSSQSLAGPWTSVGSVVPNGSKIGLEGRNDLWVSIRCCDAAAC